MKRGLPGTAITVACLLVAGGSAGGSAGQAEAQAEEAEAATCDPAQRRRPVGARPHRAGLSADAEQGERRDVDLLDRRNGVHVLRGQNGCMWSAKQTTGVVSNGCGYGPGRRRPLLVPLVAGGEDADALVRRRRYDAGGRRHGDDRGSCVGLRSQDLAVEQRRVPALRRALPGRPARRTRTASMPATRRPSCPASDSARASSRARIGTSRRIPRAGCSPTSSPPTSVRATSPSIRSTPRRAPSRRSISASSRNSAPAPCSDTVVLRDARVPDVGRARQELDEPGRQDPGRRHDRGFAPRLPRRQRHRRLPVARRQARRPARRACAGAADQGRPLEGAPRVPRLGAGARHSSLVPRSSTRSPSRAVASTRATRTSCRPTRAGARRRTSTTWSTQHTRSATS